eukprot:TRINITY_DN3403_c0_g1_i1.p1 TRINITY_DN3403_c0_g1~~TRINITY_DN3403_c0_g1_i1.p1  ORF type:complete len:372 (+),score=54.33 TRINITY_DN3403_c0_g1_i1:79-1194(+)
MATSFLPFDPSAHKIVSLTAIAGKKTRFMQFSYGESGAKPLGSADIAELENQLKTRGWCILNLDEQIESVPQLVDEMEKFFALPQEAKDKCRISPQFGYSKVDHKEGVRFLSYEFPRAAPEKLNSVATTVCRDLDNIAMRVAKRLGKLLGMSPTALALRADLPVAYRSHVGMFDVARYFNERAGQAPPPEGESIDDVNCVPHYDPGLVSISFFSNQEGLQLFDPTTDKWYAGPVNTLPGQQQYGVLWLGEAAAKVSEGKWKAGIHRVIYPALQGPRLTMWYEACTVAQVNGPDDSKPVPDGQVALPNVKGPGKMMMVSKMETQTDVLMRIERRRGLPMSKVPRIDDDFKSMENVPELPGCMLKSNNFCIKY